MSEIAEVKAPVLLQTESPFYIVRGLRRKLASLEGSLVERDVKNANCFLRSRTILIGMALIEMESALKDLRFLADQGVAFAPEFTEGDRAVMAEEVEKIAERRRRAEMHRNPAPINKTAVQGLGGPGKTAAEAASGKSARWSKNQAEKADQNRSRAGGGTGGGKKK